MSIFSVSQIGTTGVITDLDGSQSPVSAFSFASNAIFADGKVSRGPVWALYGSSTNNHNMRHLAFYSDPTYGNDHFLMMDDYASITEIASPVSSTPVSPTTGFTPVQNNAAITSTPLSGVFYFNNAGLTPQYRAMSSNGNFALLSSYNSGWSDPNNSSATVALPTSTRFSSLVAYNNMLVGINFSLGSSSNPQGLWWSDYANTFGEPPSNWAYNSTASASGQNTLAEMDGFLLDGVKLGSQLVLLGNRETWLMAPTGSTQTIFQFSRLFGAGAMSVNCAVEVDNRLYVFGDKQLWITDGTTRQAFAVGAVQNYVYANLSKVNSAQCFVFNNQKANEVMFCFPSNDQYAYFPLQNGNTGCNRAAVYNTATSTWTFRDLPYVTHASVINTVSGSSYSAEVTSGTTYQQMTGTYIGALDGSTAVTVFCSNSSAPVGSLGGISATIRIHDIYERIATLSVVDTWATSPVLLLKSAFDCSGLTQIEGLAAKLRDTKLVRSIFCKGLLTDNVAPIVIDVGVSDQQSDAPLYNAVQQTWTPVFSKLDYNVSGRFLTLRLTYSGVSSFSLDGLDFDIQLLGSYSS